MRWIGLFPSTRALPTLAVQYVTRMVFIDQPLPLSVVNSWPQSSPAGQRCPTACSVCSDLYMYSSLSSCIAEVRSVECHLHALMYSVTVVTAVFIHTMEDDQRLNTLVHEGDTLHFLLQHCKKKVMVTL